MPVNDNDARVKRTKKLIRKGLYKLSQDKNISKITVKELTDLIEINRGTFYLHYKDVFDLVESIENEIYCEFDSMISSISTEDILKHTPRVCEDFCKFFYENKENFEMLLGEHGDSNFSHKIGNLMNEKIFLIFKNIFPNMDKSKYDFAYNYIKHGVVGIVNCWFTEHTEWTARQVADMWLQLSLSGIWGVIGDEAKEVLINAYNSD